MRRITFQLACLWQILGCQAQQDQADSLPDFFGGYRANEDLCQKVSHECVFSHKVDIHGDFTDAVQLTHCVQDREGKDKRQGAFVFSRTTPAAGGAHDIYRVRMVGHEILVPQLYACNSSTIVAPYKVLIGGLYRVSVLQTYDTFTFGSQLQTRQYQSMLMASFAMEVFTSDDGWGCAWEEACPPCSDPGAEGRWIVRDPRLLGELTYCATGCKSAEVEALKTRKSAVPGISWQPYTCSLVPPEDIDIDLCLRDRQACFVGDSHMRHIQHGITSLILRDADYHEWDPSMTEGRDDVTHGLPVLKADKNVGALEAVRYYSDAWGSPWKEHNLSACTDIFMNFGTWPASFKTGPKTWPAHQVALAATNQADFLSALAQEGKRVHWVSSPSHAPDLRKWEGVDDRRCDRLLLLYNDITEQIMTDRGIPIINQFGITDPLNEMSYDSHHFKGLVGYYINARILHVFCSRGDETA